MNSVAPLTNFSRSGPYFGALFGVALVAFWPNEYSTTKKPALLDPDLLWQVFHKARAGKEPDMPKFAYVAALGLMRLKKLKLKATKREGKKEVLVFEVPGAIATAQPDEKLTNPNMRTRNGVSTPIWAKTTMPIPMSTKPKAIARPLPKRSAIPALREETSTSATALGRLARPASSGE